MTTTLKHFLQQVVTYVGITCESCGKTHERGMDPTVPWWELTDRLSGAKIWRRCDACTHGKEW